LYLGTEFGSNLVTCHLPLEVVELAAAGSGVATSIARESAAAA
jgi:hypothetical protein